MKDAKVGARIAISQLSPTEAAREALFQYMIANLDWAMVAGPAGEPCCHNTKLVGPAPGNASQLVPIPYDFDLSGFVDAPYAFPPEQMQEQLSSVRQRVYRGYCVHASAARQAATEFRTHRSQMQSVFNSIPQIDDRTRRKAWSFLEAFFNQLGAGDAVPAFLSDCLK
jgi:hypothetical protein